MTLLGEFEIWGIDVRDSYPHHSSGEGFNTEHSLFLTLYVYYFTADFELLKTMYNVKLLMIPTDLYEAGLVDDLLSDGPVILQTKGASQY